MSDLQPKGAELELGGVKRHLLFTLAAVDEIQSKYDLPVNEVIELMQDDRKVIQVAYDLIYILINDEIARNRYFNGSTEEPVTEQSLKWMMNTADMPKYIAALLIAYGLSIPDPEDDDPNAESLSN